MGALAGVDTRRRLKAERKPHDRLRFALPPDVTDKAPLQIDEVVDVAAEVAELQGTPLLNARASQASAQRSSRSQIRDPCVAIPAGHPLAQVDGHRMDVGEQVVGVSQLEFSCP